MTKSLELVGPCTFSGRLYDMGRYPALKEGADVITGELYKISDQSVLQALDTYEATDNVDPTLPGFSRKLITLAQPKVQAWIYYYDGAISKANYIPQAAL